MRLNDEAVDELKRIHLKVYGKPLSDVEAQRLGLRLLRFFALITSGPESKFSTDYKEKITPQV